MRLDTGQHMRIDQRMKLGPRMIQSMEILQMPQAALEQRIEEELGSNPTLEQREGAAEARELAQQRTQDERDNREGEREMVVGGEGKGGEEGSADDFERLSNLSEEYADSWSSNTAGSSDRYTGGGDLAGGASGSYSKGGGGFSGDGEPDAKMDAMANAAARTASLYDQLMGQWHLVEAPDEVAAAGEYLISQIDADGYLRTPMDTLADQCPRDIDPDALAPALALLQQSLEPPGLGAGDLRECLLIQIDAKRRQDGLGSRSENGAKPNPHDMDPGPLALERLLVHDHLKDIEANRYPRIAKVTGVPIEDIKAAVHNLRQFHPHPGKLLAEDEVSVIHPDAVIEYDEDHDEYHAQLTRGRLPGLAISRRYQRMAKDKGTEKATRDFIHGHLRSATWLIDAIRQRQATLLRVIGVVVEAQRAFFEQGPQALRPLPMTQVADQLGIHVATVSRAVSDKYLQTPRGIFPLRMFFSGGTETESGEAMSWAAVQAKLEQVIAEEDKADPLSDEALAEKLKEQGIDIARRTVAKYRKQLNLPAAQQRKEY